MQVFDILYVAGEDDFSSSDIVKKKKKKCNKGKNSGVKRIVLFAAKILETDRLNTFRHFT